MGACTNCTQDNSSSILSAAYCFGCGVRIGQTCTVCEQLHPVAFRYCPVYGVGISAYNQEYAMLTERVKEFLKTSPMEAKLRSFHRRHVYGLRSLLACFGLGVFGIIFQSAILGITAVVLVLLSGLFLTFHSIHLSFRVENVWRTYASAYPNYDTVRFFVDLMEGLSWCFRYDTRDTVVAFLRKQVASVSA